MGDNGGCVASTDGKNWSGQNPGTNHPRMLGDLRKAAMRGARIVVLNPIRERGLERVEQLIVEGQNVTAAFHSIGFFPPLVKRVTLRCGAPLTVSIWYALTASYR